MDFSYKTMKKGGVSYQRVTKHNGKARWLAYQPSHKCSGKYTAIPKLMVSNTLLRQ